MATLPKLSAQQPIVNPDRKPSSPFLQFMEEARTAQIETDARQDETDSNLAATIAALNVAVTRLNAVVFANQQTTVATQAAAQAANLAQQTADDALGTGTVSGVFDDPSVSLAGTGWVPGPQVDLSSVVAGTLTLSGTGPQQDLDVQLSPVPGVFAGEVQVVEIVGVTEDVVAGPFSFSAYQALGETTATVSFDDAADVASFSAAASSTGAVSYRLDARRVSGSAINDLSLYIYARRAP